MTEEQLRRIETELGIVLPAAYREAMLTGGFPRRGEDFLIEDPAQIVAENREYRAAGFHGLEWPPHYYAFGFDAEGNRYFFDLTGQPPTVWFANSETGERELEAESFEEWLRFAFETERYLDEERAGHEAEEEALQVARNLAEARKHEYPQLSGQKAWWQFWK